MAVALELAEQIAEGGGQQTQDRAARARDQGARGSAPCRGRGIGQAQRRQRRLAGRGVQLGEQAVRVGRRGSAVGGGAQYAPRRPSTTGMVRAMIVRSSQIDHVSM